MNIAGYGWSGIILLIGVFGLPYVFSASLDPSLSEKEIRRYLAWRMTQDQMSVLQVGGRKLPDRAMALKWEEQHGKLDALEFVTLEIKRAWLRVPFRRRTNFVVRAVTRDEDGTERTRYYWFYRANPAALDVRESSEFSWRFPI